MMMITQEEYEGMLIEIYELMDADDGSEEEKELIRLCDLVEEYENEYYPILGE
jgi:hypothetical protein